MPPATLCPEDQLAAIVSAMRTDEDLALRSLEAKLASYPADARLHFLKGSLLAGRQDYAGARLSMRKAVDLAPEFAIARFQLGLLLLTSGEPFPAQEAWGPLHALAPQHPLRLFAEGLGHLIGDAFGDAIRLLEAGIERNHENAPLNRDMTLIVEEIRARMKSGGAGPASAVGSLLQQAALKATRH